MVTKIWSRKNMVTKIDFWWPYWLGDHILWPYFGWWPYFLIWSRKKILWPYFMFFRPYSSLGIEKYGHQNLWSPKEKYGHQNMVTNLVKIVQKKVGDHKNMVTKKKLVTIFFSWWPYRLGDHILWPYFFWPYLILVTIKIWC